ncbi:MAG: type II toxin-antitoxin system VapC family toxin [Deltaproteobacteria bacterium]|nr:type II toxin-antitoxin system VapC family toxin [Deltaproteobacteria bacterium]
MTQYVVDTCVLSDAVKHARDGTWRHPMLRARLLAILAEQDLCVSVVSLYELRRGLLAGQVGARRRAELTRLLEGATSIDMGWSYEPTWAKAAELFAAVPGGHGDADIFIAATAITLGRVLLASDRGLAAFLVSAGSGPAVEFLAPDDPPPGGPGPE